MGARSKARKRALDILFESELQGLPPGGTLLARQGAAQPLNPYTVTLVEGVAENLADIDAVITTYSTHWPLERMPAVDRTILRIGIFELRYADVPTAVAIDEAVELARELSTDHSPAFVNGLLGAVARRSPTAPEDATGTA